MPGLQKRWLLGKLTTNKSITPLTLNSDGTFTAGTLVSLEHKLEDYRYVSEGSNENIAPMDSSNINEVIVEDGIAMEFREIIPAASASVFETAVLSKDYFLIQWTVGGYDYDFYGVRRPGCGPTYAKGKNLYQLNLGPVAMDNSGVPTGNLTRTVSA